METHPGRSDQPIRSRATRGGESGRGGAALRRPHRAVQHLHGAAADLGRTDGLARANHRRCHTSARAATCTDRGATAPADDDEVHRALGLPDLRGDRPAGPADQTGPAHHGVASPYQARPYPAREYRLGAHARVPVSLVVRALAGVAEAAARAGRGGPAPYAREADQARRSPAADGTHGHSAARRPNSDRPLLRDTGERSPRHVDGACAAAHLTATHP